MTESQKRELVEEAKDVARYVAEMNERSIFEMTADSEHLQYLVTKVVPLLKYIKVGNNISSAINNYYAYLTGSDTVVDDEMASFIDFHELIESAQYQAPDMKTGDRGRQPQNLIFHGAPGTGKTYNVLKTVAELVSEEHKDDGRRGYRCVAGIRK